MKLMHGFLEQAKAVFYQHVSETKKRRANAELEASMTHRLERLRTQPRDARGRYMRTGGRATWKNRRTV
ncbi:hypothetical protein AD951_04300 [Acetobacter malorum]|uniref:Uncharacterized protein n=1 Tax=Acetobacter malorum TaxID=178901 RepID=A0A149UPN3_9PROT|nr:hypothetical protein [Acetobacter malorum]KXV69950.1 hypothetical protein AD951_04300 [Acetobacter malorum]